MLLQQREQLRQRMIDQGADPVSDTPEQFAAQIRADLASWARVVKASGAKAD